MQELLFKAKTMSVALEFAALSAPPQSPVLSPRLREDTHAVTVLRAEGVSSDFLSDLTDLVMAAGGRVLQITRLSSHNLSCLELSLSIKEPLRDSAPLHDFRAALWALSRRHGTDVALQEESIFRHNKRMVVFDMDSTLIAQEATDEIAHMCPTPPRAHRRRVGVGERVRAITAAAMNGEMDFGAALRQRVALFEGAKTSIFRDVIARIEYTEGGTSPPPLPSRASARTLCRALKRLGYKLAVISGGFSAITDFVKSELGLDFAFANALEVDGDELTGRVVGPIVDAQRKADLLMAIAQQGGIRWGGGGGGPRRPPRRAQAGAGGGDWRRRERPADARRRGAGGGVQRQAARARAGAGAT
jgi:phosphoserine phosphatase